MIDCSNVEMRDRLPDLVNETLVAADRERVLAHLAGCAACTAEIEILRTTRLMLRTATPKVNAASIALALPTYGSRGASTAGVGMSRRARWGSSWRIAAAVTVLAAGFGSYQVLSNGSPARTMDTMMAAVDTTTGLALTGALASLSDAELTALASDIADIEALPTEVGAVANPAAPTILPDSALRDLEIF